MKLGLQGLGDPPTGGGFPISQYDSGLEHTGLCRVDGARRPWVVKRSLAQGEPWQPSRHAVEHRVTQQCLRRQPDHAAGASAASRNVGPSTLEEVATAEPCSEQGPSPAGGHALAPSKAQNAKVATGPEAAVPPPTASALRGILEDDRATGIGQRPGTIDVYGNSVLVHEHEGIDPG
jgi:hypothetical protein